MLPCVIFEDEHLLVVNKPAGLNTHAPSPYAGEGIYDWLRHRESRWASLAIIHRLDKETSGVLVFSKTRLANQSLTEQFTRHTIRKKYVLLTDRQVPPSEFTVKSSLVRVGDKYVSRAGGRGGEAETRFRVPSPESKVQSLDALIEIGGYSVIEAEPVTGRTHQIRIHASEKGFPILGDTLYGGSPAERVYLHAAELTLRHPASGKEVTFAAPSDFEADARFRLRAVLIDSEATDAYRMVNGASDGWPGWYVDRFGDYLLSQSEGPLDMAQMKELSRLMELASSRGAYHKLLTRQVRRTTVAEASPTLVIGEPTPERFAMRENGLKFELSFGAGYSAGLFLDQRDNRRRLLTGHVAADFSLLPPTLGTQLAAPKFRTKAGHSVREILNTFAYTCGFSVCAAKAGARTTSLDLSEKYLEWGRRNFVLNGLDPADHDFIYGDAFDWLRRLARKNRLFDVVLLDPPTFSQSKEHGVFRVEKDYGKLVSTALPLVKLGGVLFASTNAADWPPEKFLNSIEEAVRTAKRKILQTHYVPQPPDFPVSRPEPAYLKTVWMRIE
ncbi:MAG: rRNA (cytosine1962-C5)-methyltransferase [Verrucomicrobiota bacterium]